MLNCFLPRLPKPMKEGPERGACPHAPVKTMTMRRRILALLLMLALALGLGIQTASGEEGVILEDKRLYDDHPLYIDLDLNPAESTDDNNFVVMQEGSVILTRIPACASSPRRTRHPTPSTIPPAKRSALRPARRWLSSTPQTGSLLLRSHPGYGPVRPHRLCLQPGEGGV